MKNGELIMNNGKLSGSITDEELQQLTDKSSRDAEIVELYRQNDFLTAYGRHTDMRVKEDPQLAIGGEWETYGNIQRDFLIAQGLRPHHRLLDVGCGTGRLARVVVRGLHAGNYVGLDISSEALAHARQLSQIEGWASKNPLFDLLDVDDIYLSLCDRPAFDFAWAFSVFIHLPSEIVESMISLVNLHLAPRGKFFFSYVPTKLPDNTRTGLKQFKHPLSFYEKLAGTFFSLVEVPWPGRQRILKMERR